MSATVGAVSKLCGCDKSRHLWNADIPNSSSTADCRSCIQKYKHILNEDIHTRCIISCCKYWTRAHTHMHTYKNIHDTYTIHAEGESLILPTHITLTKLSRLLFAYITCVLHTRHVQVGFPLTTCMLLWPMCHFHLANHNKYTYSNIKNCVNCIWCSPYIKGDQEGSRGWAITT